MGEDIVQSLQKCKIPKGFGKLGSKYSWQYDILAKYKVTIGGELKFLMLVEDLSLIKDVEIVSINTDGVVVHYPLSAEVEVDKIHKEWEEKTTYILENTSYKQAIFSNVNNYIAEIIDEDTEKTIKIKYKGDFVVNSADEHNYHKDNSQSVVALAVTNYFIKNIPIKQTIENHKDIFDFCIGRKGTKQAHYAFIKGNERIDIPDKVIRYYISKNGYKIYKIYANKHSAINKGFKAIPFMKYKDQDKYDIDYDYYINECNKIIRPIEIGTRRLHAPKFKQMTIFDLGA